MPLPFQPKCRPTILGPLPYARVSDAWSIVLKYMPMLPAVPIPIGANESLAAIGARGFDGINDETSMVYDREKALRGLDGLYAAYLRGSAATRAIDIAALSYLQRSEQPLLKGCRAVFGNLVGPISLALLLADEEGIPLANEPLLLDGLSQHLFLRQLWMHQVLQRTGKPAVVWLYEPFAAVLRSPYLPGTPANFYAALDQALGNKMPRAVWLSDVEVAMMLSGTIAIDLIGMPLPQPEAAAQAAAMVSQMIVERRGIGWGIVPVTPDAIHATTVGRLAARFEEWSQALAAVGVPPDDLASVSLVMPEDTLQYLEPADAERVLVLTSELASVLQQSYGVE
jgi:hypothetical protein